MFVLFHLNNKNVYLERNQLKYYEINLFSYLISFLCLTILTLADVVRRHRDVGRSIFIMILKMVTRRWNKHNDRTEIMHTLNSNYRSICGCFTKKVHHEVHFKKIRKIIEFISWLVDSQYCWRYYQEVLISNFIWWSNRNCLNSFKWQDWIILSLLENIYFEIIAKINCFNGWTIKNGDLSIFRNSFLIFDANACMLYKNIAHSIFYKTVLNECF